MSCLKIKDGIDLKELEKFGFEKGYHKLVDKIVEYYSYGEMIIYLDSREIYTFKMRMDTVIKFFDLVQAGMVEKVER